VNVLVLGATGMIGQGALLECLRDADVERVITIGRRSTGRVHEKLEDVVHGDLSNLGTVEHALTGLDACLFCIGVSAMGMSEEAYARVSYDLTMAVAATLVRTSPQMTFVYVSGAGSDSTERGRFMWARVKGRTENALLGTPFGAVYIVRPGFIVPLDGIRSSTPLYNAGYTLARPLLPILQRVAPRLLTTTRQLGRAMLAVAKHGYETRILEMTDIRRF
jgi:uncharacterized protein YbjT (DUF2867 family)